MKFKVLKRRTSFERGVLLGSEFFQTAPTHSPGCGRGMISDYYLWVAYEDATCKALV